MNGSDPLPAPKPAPTTVAGKIGETAVPAGALDPALFANIVAQREDKTPAEPKTSPEPAAGADPENPEPPAELEIPGQENLQPEEIAAERERIEAKATELGITGKEVIEQEAAERQAAEEAAAGEADLSQLEPEVAAALKGLNADGRKHVIEVAKAIADGETTLGEVRRRMELGRKENEELQRLREENEQLRSAPAVSSPLPETVAKLKTVAEVQARTATLETQIDQLEDFIEKNPSGGQIGDKEFTREQLVDIKRSLRNELKVLPARAQQLTQAAELTQARAGMREATVRDFPYYAQADHPDTKVAAQLLKQRPEFQQFPNADYLALAMARGHNSLQAELAKRKAGVKPGVQTARPAGAVAAKKPAAGAAPAKVTQPAAAAKPATELVKGVKDKASFADLLTATGR